MYEKVSIFTLLGIRFWDSVSDKQVSDNLLVSAVPGNGSGTGINAFRTASGIYAFQGFPGLRDVEAYDGDGVPPPPASGKKNFIIKVEDKLRRFLPLVFTVDLPLSYKGVFFSDLLSAGPESSPPLEEPPPFYLFSAPARTMSPGTAAISTTLVDQTTGKPAAYAVMEVEVVEEGITWYGMADHRGCLTVRLPYPLLTIPLDSSPSGSTGISLYEQEWDLAIRVKYSPTTLSYPPGMDIPYLEKILQQSYGFIWKSGPESPPTGSYVSEWSTVLVFGQELILKTEGLTKSELWIEAGTSP